ncbi:MAG: hypothetical protein IKW45_08200, partial [Clostridia bacterium]|nr:hypothetical protein [Clostridia bacterium]
MKNSKKLLSLFLAVVMVLSVFTVMASAYTVGPEVSGDINFKYTVEAVDVIPESADGSSAELAGDNFYAVSVWMQANKGVTGFTVPFHYNKAHFSPVTLTDGDCTYPYGAGLDQDTYASDMGESTIYAFTHGDYMLNTGMYKADGSTATTKALAKCIGLGNSNSVGVTVLAELVSPDHSLYAKWSAGLPADTGILYAQVQAPMSAATTKTAYLNTISGINPDTGWNKMFTVYFEAIADDVTGDEFGVFTEDCFTVDGVVDSTYGYFTGTSAKLENPNKNVVSNAVVEAAAEPSPVFAKSSQIRFNNGIEGDANFSFDVRTRAAMTAEDFAAICGDDATAKNAIESIGFVYADSS